MTEAAFLANVAPVAGADRISSLSRSGFLLGKPRDVVTAPLVVVRRSLSFRINSRNYCVDNAVSSTRGYSDSEKISSCKSAAGGDAEVASSRRAATICLLGTVSLSIIQCDTAVAAFAPGFPGMKDWLKGQKQKTAKFLLAPINASRDRLSSALLLISADDTSSGSYEEAGNLVKVAARDCMPLEGGSIMDLQSRTGVEVCTFKLVLKNAASLLDNTDPAKQRAEESLRELIRSFVILDELLAVGATGGFLDRKNLEGVLKETTLALDRFEGGVRACLGIV